MLIREYKSEIYYIQDVAPNRTNYLQEEDELFSFPYMFMRQQLVLNQNIEKLLKTINTDSEPEGSSLAPHHMQQFSMPENIFMQNPTGLPKHVCFRFAADDPI